MKCEKAESLFLSHSVSQHHAGDDTGKRGEQSARKRITGFFDLCRHKVDGHGVKNRLSASHHNGNQSAKKRVGPVLFKNVQNQSGGGARREHPHDGYGNELRGKTQVLQKMAEHIRKHIQKSGSTQDAHCNHQSNQSGQDADDGLKTVHRSFYEGFVYILFF